ncbi:RNA methyltransferase [Halalkaliarchaeum sp. AArc-GB]|uniref:RNA methyltransferase n=1 Tax=Halalkaliarchaeum sp. AArc-GB TaxID=3074078 RepID=UPI002858967D|nr:RNA methyltransferase [Halalkaliarchaeum sp. AArc-GB]MDR5671579.1 RNA methyltransferase [Halalkaliarchaeum sp. AArc-GB]
MTPPGDPDGANGASLSEGAKRASFTVVVVDPQTPGNVGTIARAMKNFGLSDLALIDPPPLPEGGEAYGFAGHAREDVLPNAREVTFDEVVENYHTVGCTAITGEDARRHVRFPFRTPAKLRDSLATVETDTALVFGREGRGLDNDELRRLDEVCSIPASPEYPVLNLGQAATIVLYELRELFLEDTQLPDVERERANEPDIERVHDQFDDFLDAAGYSGERFDRTRTLFRRVLGRAHPTTREAHTLVGVFRRAADQLNHRWELVEKYDAPEWPATREADGDKGRHSDDDR